MRNLTLTIQFCDISQSFVSAIKYENTYSLVVTSKSSCALTKSQKQKKNSFCSMITLNYIPSLVFDLFDTPDILMHVIYKVIYEE
jgi:hypothetical protein